MVWKRTFHSPTVRPQNNAGNSYRLTILGYSNSFPGHLNLDASVDSNTALHHIRTAGSISISPELFEKLYLSPPNKVKGELRKTFGNPTPVYALSLFFLYFL